MSKYDPLRVFLESRQGEVWRPSFKDIERILGFPLPKSARTYNAWWANDDRPPRHSQAWLGPGWRTGQIELSGERVLFERGTAAKRSQRPKRAAKRNSKKTAKSSPPLYSERLIKSGFKEIGEWVLGGDSIKLKGEAPTGPGVYVFCIGEKARYVGSSTRSLKQRLYGYQKPGKSQKTNVRLNAKIQAELNAVHEVKILTVTPGKTKWNDLPVDLSVGLEMGLVKTFRPAWNIQGI